MSVLEGVPHSLSALFKLLSMNGVSIRRVAFNELTGSTDLMLLNQYYRDIIQYYRSRYYSLSTERMIERNADGCGQKTSGVWFHFGAGSG